MSGVTPFEEDCEITRVAGGLGLEVLRDRPVVIYDRAALEAAGLMRKAPDYRKIRQLLEADIPVDGASLGPYEYTLRAPSVIAMPDDTNNTTDPTPDSGGSDPNTPPASGQSGDTLPGGEGGQ